MKSKTVSQILIDYFELSELPAEEAEEMVQSTINTFGIEEGDNFDKVLNKLTIQLPQFFPKQAQALNTVPKYFNYLSTDSQFEIVKSKHSHQSQPLYANLDPPLHTDISTKLSQLGRPLLYLHQVQAIELIRDGKNVLITTPTASGKSYGYVLPFLDAVKKDPSTTGLFIFPMNDLMNDQFDKISEFGIGTVEKYDGSVKSYQKKKIRDSIPNALLTNPDQIHSSILRKHSEWTDFFKNLKFIVIDEIHNYKGLFGSNVSNTIFRLLNVVAKAGGNPQIICTSATIANSQAFAKKLAWRDFELVKYSAAGSPEKYHVMLDTINPEHRKVGQSEEEWVAEILKKYLEKSPEKMLYDLVLSLCENGFQSIIFVNSRLMADRMRDVVQELSTTYANVNPDMVCSYRSGLSNNERIQIERKIKDGSKKIIFTTSALELGIDIGSLDACILYGLPKTSNEIWQRIGRVGRNFNKPAMAIILNSRSGDDFFYFFNPDKFFKTKDLPEEPVIFPYNEILRKLHLQCGYLEGMTKQDVNDLSVWDTIDTVKKAESAYPSLSVRNSKFELYRLLDGNGVEIGTLESERVSRELHPGAIRRIESKTYKFQNVDYDNKKATFIELPNFEYYTYPVVKTTVAIQSATKEEILNYGNYSLLIGYGEVDVNSSLSGYLRFYQDGRQTRKSKFKSKNPQNLKTEGFWLTLVPNKAGAWSSLIPGFSNQKSFHILHSLEHLLHREIVEQGYCDTADIIGYTYEEYGGYSNPTIFFYDNYYKGLGLSQKIFNNIENLISKAIIRIMSCTCYEGCPACIYKRAYCEYNGKFTNKDLTKEFLKPLMLAQTKRSRYFNQTNSSIKFPSYSSDKFNVGDEYIPGWIVTEKTDVKYIIETAAGDRANCTFEDGLY